MTERPDAYWERATSWALDEQASRRSMGRWAWTVASLAVLVAVLEGFALLLLAPLKTVTPIPVLVDRQTGFVEVLKDNGRLPLEANAALTQSLLAQYAIARETFDISDLSAEYRKVALWSSGQARHEYLATMPASNPESPLRRYPRSSVVQTVVKSVSPIGPQTALVRFDTVQRDLGGGAARRRAWVAVINYRFSGEPMTVADRLLNPLGFQVVRYRKDEEALPPADLATPDVQAASAASQTLMSQSPAPGAQTIVSRPIYAPAQAVPSRGP